MLITDAFRSFVQVWTSATEFIPRARFGWSPGLSLLNAALADKRNSIYFADVFQCDSLSLSFLRGDKPAVSQTLKSYPYTSKEVNSLGQTPCHIAVAVGNLQILELVLLYNSPDALNTRDKSGLYPIDYAIATHAHQVCAKSQDSNACNGCKVLEMVLNNANCALYHRTLHRALYE
ncbi:uncharacterized protein GLRG_01130 [Colletotrichum graminicola M1.001]|uniref:Uncharacterized protein n=1 Tax=Colletotrichum graminicola (strain M1.001 / M2 / FGSC 10212) TaxID=645133 RepID=E3Q5L9_COLGM|nr:uncharacterized protein GLRG_01130 [Colletotrichum graminicola M1.001]EFQ25986.1 hypothetical protein GLRG_01130 [Colletotrichum graminicola M1.001]